MNCKDVKNKLPYYLSEECSIDEKLEISEHISTCEECMKALEQFEQLQEPILKNEKRDSINSMNTSILLNKARKTLIQKVVTTTILSIIIIFSTFSVVIPGILKAIRYPKIPEITRAIVDITQFTSPSIVNGFGNSLAPFGNYSFNISAYTNDTTGTKQKNSGEVLAKFNMLTGSFQSPIQPFTQFVHPNVVVPSEFTNPKSTASANKILNKNGDNTVAVVDVSLNSVISLDKIVQALKNIDVKVIWMAVECGNEGFKAKNMNNSLNQYVQWGIPGQLFVTSKIGPAKTNYTKPLQYEKTVIEELRWLDQNKHYISADKGLLKFQHFDNSVGNNVQYIIKNGFKIYGLRITGPSTQLSKLDEVLDIRMEEVKDMDFYYWN